MLSKDKAFDGTSCSKGSSIATYSSRSNSILILLKSRFDSILAPPRNCKEMFQIGLSVIAMLSLANIWNWTQNQSDIEKAADSHNPKIEEIRVTSIRLKDYWLLDPSLLQTDARIWSNPSLSTHENQLLFYNKDQEVNLPGHRVEMSCPIHHCSELAHFDLLPEF